MTAVINQDECIELITTQISNLTSNVTKGNHRKMEKIGEVWSQGVSEIQGDGLTLPTCQEMGKNMTAAEERAKRAILAGKADLEDVYMYELKTIHAFMTRLLISLGGEVNEGNKDCCPLSCSGC